jgi:hypothetical protein
VCFCNNITRGFVGTHTKKEASRSASQLGFHL